MKMDGQINFFDMTRPAFRIDRPVRLIELFAGVGSQAMALRDLGADFEHYRISEWEVSANRSYRAIHNPDDHTDYSGKFKKFKWLARVLYEYGISSDGKTRLTRKEIRNRGEKWCRQVYNEFRANHNTGSIVNTNALDLEIVDTDKYCYIMTYSFPCQDLSIAGKQKGMAKGSGTRSGLLWEVERMLNECSELPQVLLMENVPQVHSKANMPDFQRWIDFLEGKGYSNYWQNLNAKDYGVAQNRNRCFMVSLLGEWNYKFPQPVPLERKLKDYLEDEVEENYYINTEKAQKLLQTLIENGTLKDGVLYPYDTDFEMEENFNQRGKVHGEESICRTIMGGGSHGGNEPKILVDLSLKNPTQKTVSNCITAKDYTVSNVGASGNGVVEQIWNLQPFVVTERRLGNIYGFDGGNYAGNVYDDEMLSPAIRTYQGGNQQPMIVAMRGRNPDNPSDRTAGSPTEQRLEPNSQGICNALTSVQKDNTVLEKAILTPKRTEYGKSIRKAYESGEIKESRHNMTELEPRSDGISNTLTTVQKDNLVLENICINDRGFSEKEPQVSIGTVPTLRAETHGNLPKVIEMQYRIRKLTPLECWRLMGFSDEDFHKAEEVSSNTQLYKQAGNSIVKNVLVEIFRQMVQEGGNTDE